MSDPKPTPAAFVEALAEMFHDTYERLSRQFISDHTPMAWSNLPQERRNLMTAATGEFVTFLGQGGTINIGDTSATMEPHKPKVPGQPEAIQEAPMEVLPVITIEPED